MKYTKGMRVRCLKDYHTGCQFTAGKEYVIRVDDDEDCRVVADDSGEPNGWNGEFFEIVAPKRAFKVGDRVRVVKRGTSGHGRAVGEEFTLSEFAFDRFWRTSDGPDFYPNEIEPVAVAPQSQLTIQAGKFYKTRDGRKVGPMEDNPSKNEFWPFKWSRYHYRDDGHSCFDNLGSNHRKADDLIAEWVDEPAADAPVAAPVAEQPAAKPKFKVGDRVRLVREGLSTTGAIGLTAVIKSIDDGASWPILLLFDKQDVRRFKTVAHPSHYTRAVEDDIEPTGVGAPFAFIGGKATFRADQFIVHSGTNPSTPAIVCLVEKGQPLPSDRPHVHASTKAAEREAARLARKHKGKEFAVFELGSSCRREPAEDEPEVEPETKPDATLSVTITADTSALDAEIDRVKRRLKNLAKRSRKLGISLEFSDLQDAA